MKSPDEIASINAAFDNGRAFGNPAPPCIAWKPWAALAFLLTLILGSVVYMLLTERSPIVIESCAATGAARIVAPAASKRGVP